MDRERVDDGPEHGGHAPPSLRREEAAPAPSVEQGPAMGNSAFSRLLASTLGSGVARAAAASQGAGPLAPEIAGEIEQARHGGAPLPGGVRAEMEAGLGADLSPVRVHNDNRADQLNRSVRAEAFTTGTDVFFRSGAYAPGSSDGQRLLAHELTHVVQQGSGQVEGGRVSHPDDANEVEARQVADALVSERPAAGSPVDRSPSDAGAPAAAGDEYEEEAPEAAVSRELDEDQEEEPEVAP